MCRHSCGFPSTTTTRRAGKDLLLPPLLLFGRSVEAHFLTSMWQNHVLCVRMDTWQKKLKASQIEGFHFAEYNFMLMEICLGNDYRLQNWRVTVGPNRLKLKLPHKHKLIKEPPYI